MPGLHGNDIAAAFLIPPATMGQRLVRAKSAHQGCRHPSLGSCTKVTFFQQIPDADRGHQGNRDGELYAPDRRRSSGIAACQGSRSRSPAAGTARRRRSTRRSTRPRASARPARDRQARAKVTHAKRMIISDSVGAASLSWQTVAAGSAPSGGGRPGAHPASRKTPPPASTRCHGRNAAGNDDC